MLNMHVFLFCRDFRLTDNLGLIQALRRYKRVVPIFVFTPEQADANQNPYFSHPSMQFLCEGLEDLARQIQGYEGRLYMFYGNLEECLTKIHHKVDISSLHFNIDYTPYARRRTDRLRLWCKAQNRASYAYEDYLLRPIGTFVKKNQMPYQVYSAFRQKVEQYIPLIPEPSGFGAFAFEQVDDLEEDTYPIEGLARLYTLTPGQYLHGGRREGKRLLADLPKDYIDHRHILALDTTHLAPYIKYGAVSVREVFHRFLQIGDDALWGQLIWREFYTYIAYYFPEVLQGAFFQKKYARMSWEDNTAYVQAWQEGRTGYPIVDACMRELNATGYMHNRGRLICASFFNRILHVDWRRGERYFAQRLIDYDPAVNNGNWQWVASTGVDPKPYFQRLFNPYLQGKRFDPQAKYIKRWLPQLADLPAKVLHAWNEYYRGYDLGKRDYYAPIVDYKEARVRSLYHYRQLT